VGGGGYPDAKGRMCVEGRHKIKRSWEGPCQSGGRRGTRGGQCGRYEDNRERVQRHDPIAAPRVTGFMKGATIRGTGGGVFFFFFFSQTDKNSSNAQRTLQTSTLRSLCETLGSSGNPHEVRLHWYGFQTKMTKPATEPNFHCTCALEPYRPKCQGANCSENACPTWIHNIWA